MRTTCMEFVDTHCMQNMDLIAKRCLNVFKNINPHVRLLMGWLVGFSVGLLVI